MRRSTPIFAAVAFLVAAVGCHVDDLVNTPPSGEFVAAPASVVITAAAGSSAEEALPLAVRGTRGDSLHWTASRAVGGEWLTLGESEGTTPDTLHLTLVPTGRPAGIYRDTILLTSDTPDAAPTRVPVTMILQACDAGTLTLGSTISDSLRTTDCASLHHAGRPARRYRFSGDAGDSISFHLSSAAFPVVLSIDTTDAADAPSLATSTECGSVDGACIRYLTLPRRGNYAVEVTSSGTGSGTGAFTLLGRAPGTPSSPDSLRQTRADSTSTISVGGATPDPEIVVRGVLRDPDVGDTMRLEVELLPVGTSFTGEVTATSAPTVAGGTAFVRLPSLVDGTAYHWRSRVVDQTGRATDWASFGGNAETASDLRVAIEADRLRFQQPPTTTAAGAAITPAVQVAAVDRDGAVVTSFDGTITVALATAPTGATLSGDRSATAVNGVATFPGLSLNKAGSGYTLLASSSGMIDATSPEFSVTAGAAAHVAFSQQPTGSSPNAPITPAVTVTVTDANGNVATSFTGGVTIALGRDGSLLGNAHLSGTLTVAAAAGVARFTDLRIDQLGTGYTLVASVAGVGGATSAGFDIVPLAGSPTEQSFTRQPNSAIAGSAIVPAVEVTIRDGLGMPVTDFDGPVTLALTGGPPGAVLSGTLSQLPSSGVARFSDLKVDRAGTGNRLLASTTGLPDATSEPFDITAAPPTTGAIAVTTTTSGNDLDPDGYTAVVAGVTHSIAANGTTTFTDLAPGGHPVALNGIASNCTLSGPNPRDVTVTAGTTTPVDFTITCTTTSPATGDLLIATHTTGSDLDADGYTVSVTGAGSRGLAVNASTTFTALPAGATQVSLTGVATNCTVSGEDPRSLTVPAGGTASTTFEVTCAPITPPPPPATALRFTVEPPATMLVGGTFGAAVTAYDVNGAPVSGFTGRVTLTLSGGLLGTALAGTTAVNATGGVATFGDLHLTGPCINCVLVASSSPLAGATSAPFTVVIPL